MSFNIISKTLLYPSVSVKRKPPVNINPEDEKFYEHERERILPEVNLCHLQNVNISPEGIVFRNFEVYEQCLVDPSRKIFYNWKYLLSNYLKRKKITLPENEKYILVFDEWSNGYFHWMCDVLPRLVSIKSILPECILLLPENYSQPFIKETLKPFNLKSIKYIFSNSYVNISELLMPEHIATVGNFNVDLMLKLKTILLNYFNHSQKSPFGDKIYVSRVKATKRKIINEDELFCLLKKKDFRIVCFEDHSIEEQISIAFHTKYLIGLHGAGLTNILFMDPDSTLLELKPENDYLNHCYFSLASDMGIHYYYQFCKRENANHNVQDTNVFINIKILQETIDKMFYKNNK